jgi:hypothetical protein
MAQRAKSIQHKIKMQKIVELLIGTLTASVVILQVWNDGMGNILNNLPGIFR